MKNFNKTLLALSVAAASSMAMAANTLVDLTDPDNQNGCETDAKCSTVSAQGVALGNTTLDHTGVKLTVDSEVADVRRVLVEVSGAKFTLNTDNDAALGGDIATQDSKSLVSLSALAFDFDAGNEKIVDKNGEIKITNLELDLEGANAGDVATVTVKLQEKVGSGYVTASSASASVAEVVNQFALSSADKAVTAAGKDIAPVDRLNFDDSTLTDSFKFTVAEKTVNYNTAIGSGDYTLSVAADFSFLDADGDGEIDGDNSVAVGNNAVTFAEDFQSFTYKASADNIDGDSDTKLTDTVTFEFDGETEIPELYTTADLEFAYTTGGSNSNTITGGEFADSFKAIDWNLAGDSASFKYMPYGDNISQIIYVTNEGSVDGVATVTGYDSDGNKFGPVQLDTAVTAKGVTKLTGAIEDAMMAEGFDGQGPLNLNISVTGSGMSFYGAYNVGGTDRGYVPAGD